MEIISLKNSDFEEVLNKGQKLGNEILLLAILRKNNQHKRVGFAISKEIKGSVKRNRIRRQLREIYRQNHMKVPYGGFDMVTLARKIAKFKEFEYAFSELLDKANNYNSN